MGFKAGAISAPSVVRRLETAGWGGSRDHFFHSFQNYFFGLFAIGQLISYFAAWRDAAHLQFNVATLDAWFLTALWHDVGYSIEKYGDIAGEIFGISDDDMAGDARAEYLRNSIVQKALREISCLTVRLLTPAGRGPRWAIPLGKWRRLPEEKIVAEALEENFHDSHGAASALRLYTDFRRQIDRMTAARQANLHPTVLVACCSIPFHDFRFRDALRRKLGTCSISTDRMPFAGLLAFIDSIQDDRRDLAGVREEIGFLERLLTREPATVTAEVNPHAIGPGSFLWKMVEARDVFGSLCQTTNGLYFEYPAWMVP
jgi:hypothetical protein